MTEFIINYGAVMLGFFSLLLSGGTFFIAWRALQIWKQQKRFDYAQECYGLFTQLSIYLPTAPIVMMGDFLADMMDSSKKVNLKNRTKNIEKEMKAIKAQDSINTQNIKMIGDVWKQTYSAKLFFPELEKDIELINDFISENQNMYGHFKSIRLASPDGTDIIEAQQAWLKEYEPFFDFESEKMKDLEQAFDNILSYLEKFIQSELRI
ncbi:MAG: hypothetical protein K0U39_07040 [Alphaproteobacteria bacterium]|nr:hypothetical protein [Alphaproteobacteria bacterium]